MPLTTMDRRNLVDGLLFDYRSAVETLKAERSALKEAKIKTRTIRKAQAFIQTAAQEVQTDVIAVIGSLVTRCLQTIFGDVYRFKIEFERKRGKTEANLYFVDKDGNKVEAEEECGGAREVAAFGLRLACLMLANKRRLIVLDEPFRFVSPRNRSKIKNLLEQLAEELKFQIILVTHDTELRCGTVYHLTKGTGE